MMQSCDCVQVLCYPQHGMEEAVRRGTYCLHTCHGHPKVIVIIRTKRTEGGGRAAWGGAGSVWAAPPKRLQRCEVRDADSADAKSDLPIRPARSRKDKGRAVKGLAALAKGEAGAHNGFSA